MTEPKNQSADFVGDTILEVVRDFPAWANVAKITKLAPSMCRSLRNQTKLPWKHIEINSEYWISKSYESIPRRKKPVAICNNQKTNATNARLCPRKSRDTGNVTTSCLSRKLELQSKDCRKCLRLNKATNADNSDGCNRIQVLMRKILSDTLTIYQGLAFDFVKML